MSTSSTKPRLAHLPELDGLRGIAALMVLCHHLFFTSVPNPESWNGFVSLTARLSQMGGSGVDLFFVLSGFLITSLLILDRESAHFYWNFYWKRILRILPVCLTALLLLLFLMPSSWRYTLLSFLFLANFAPVFHVASAGPFWTLAIEEQFYLIWPRFTRTLTLDRLERLALRLVIASPMLRLIAAGFGHHNYEFTFFHCDGLALGAMLACQEIRGRSASTQISLFVTKPSVKSLLEPAAIAVIAMPLLVSPLVLSLRFDSGSKFLFAADALQITGVNLLAYSILAVLVRRTGSRRLLIFRSQLLTFFGLISYSLYVANGYVVLLYDHLRGPMQIGNMQQYAIRAAAIFAATLLVCIVSRYVIELPAMSLRKHVLRRP